MLFARQPPAILGQLELPVVCCVDGAPFGSLVLPSHGRDVRLSGKKCRHDPVFPVPNLVTIPVVVLGEEALGNERGFFRGVCHVSS